MGLIILNIFLLLLGFVLVVKGADFFVDGAAGIAKKLHVSSFIIGVTVVAIGTSAPELAVTIVDVIQSGGELVLGNVLGSNIMNIFLILGISAILSRLPIEKSTRMVDLPGLIVVSVMTIMFGWTESKIVWWEGLILLLLFLSFMAYNIVLATKQSKAAQLMGGESQVESVSEEKAEAKGIYQKYKAGYEILLDRVWFLIIIAIVGLGMVVGGAQLVVMSARYIAVDVIGIDPEIIAFTVVAIGTSLPELMTSVSAARKGDVGIATGNIIGSNIANLLLIIGVGGLAAAGNGILFTMEALIGGVISTFAAVLVWGFSFTKTKSLTRVAGIVMLVCLVAYYAFLFLNEFLFHIY